jgi:hypothetical protein
MTTMYLCPRAARLATRMAFDESRCETLIMTKHTCIQLESVSERFHGSRCNDISTENGAFHGDIDQCAHLRKSSITSSVLILSDIMLNFS